MVENMQPTEYGMNTIHNLSSGPLKNSDILWLLLEVAEDSFRNFLWNF